MKTVNHIVIFASAAIIALTSCAKTEPSGSALQNRQDAGVVQFMAAKYATKADEGVNRSEFTGPSFGAYAWASDREGYFMENLNIIKKVILHDNVAWAPRDTTVYWPATGTVDFICYYPWVSDEGYITVEPNTIKYTNYDVKSVKTSAKGSYDGQTDLMYADKAVGYSFIPDQAEEQGYTNVPAIFNHALAKVAIRIAQTYSSKTEAGADGKMYTTRWQVRVNSARFVGAAANGSATFTMPKQQYSGQMVWIKPFERRMVKDTPTDFCVWKPGERKFDDALPIQSGGLELDILKRDEKGYVIDGFKTLMPETYVIPQLLDSGEQQVEIKLSIDTYLSCEGGEEKKSGTENISRIVNLRIPEKVEAWQISQYTIYYIMVSPAYGDGNGGHGTGDPLSPTYPVDPLDPDLSDSYVTFDPTVEHFVPAVIGL